MGFLSLFILITVFGKHCLSQQLLWSDEFNTNNVDANWIQETGGHGWGNNELQFYTTSNTRIQNGNLFIDTRREQYQNRQYTSSRLISRNSFKYGVFEMRAKLPRGRGTWPAFWLLGDKRPLNWPDDGEIDVMEHVGYDPAVIHGTIHCKKYNHMIGTQKGKSTRITDPFDTYHTYTLDWNSKRIQVFVDGYKYFEYIKEDNSYDSWPFDNSFNIILNTAVGGDWGGAQGVDDSVFPQVYTIDYVRQYAASEFISRNIHLVAKVNGKYVSAENYGNAPLIADRDTASQWETFELIQNKDGTVSIRAAVNKKYVSATDSGNGELIAKEDVDNLWENFNLIQNNDGSHSFKAKVNGKYVCAENAGASALKANKDTNGLWESFFIIYL